MRVTIGRIGRPHGIHGEVTVEVRTDEPDAHYQVGSNLIVGDRIMTIDQLRWHNSRLLVRFGGVDSRTGAEDLRGLIIEADRPDDARPSEPDTYYDSALVGCAVRTTTGEHLGAVAEVIHLPGQDLLAVTRADGGEVLIPFVAAMVPDVDLDSRAITVDPPPGLLDAE
jgi:16S rRNA processing protein RimM